MDDRRHCPDAADLTTVAAWEHRGNSKLGTPRYDLSYSLVEN